MSLQESEKCVHFRSRAERQLPQIQPSDLTEPLKVISIFIFQRLITFLPFRFGSGQTQHLQMSSLTNQHRQVVSNEVSVLVQGVLYVDVKGTKTCKGRQHLHDFGAGVFSSIIRVIIVSVPNLFCIEL